MAGQCCIFAGGMGRTFHGLYQSLSLCYLLSYGIGECE